MPTAALEVVAGQVPHTAVAWRAWNVASLVMTLFPASLSSFKQFLELEPQLRDVLSKFHQSQYTSCLQTLGEMRSSLMLDLYLAPHLPALYAMVRNKALIQVWPLHHYDVIRGAWADLCPSPSVLQPVHERGPAQDGSRLQHLCVCPGGRTHHPHPGWTDLSPD